MGSSPSKPKEEQVSWSRYQPSDFTEDAHSDYHSGESSRDKAHYHSGESSRDKAEVDGRDKGAVTPIKSQRGGSCWAVATVDLLESFFEIRTGTMCPSPSLCSILLTAVMI